MISAALVFPAHSATDPVKGALALYKKNHYEDAAGMLLPHVSKSKPAESGAANLTLGMIFLNNARLHDKLYQLSLTLHNDYLERLSKRSGKDKSRFIRLYLGEAFLEAGRSKKAAAYLGKFIGYKKTPKKYRDIARAKLGLAYFMQGKKKKAKAVWSRLPGSDPELLSELAHIYVKAGISKPEPVSLCKKALQLLKKRQGRPSARMVKNIIGVYADKGLVDEGLALLALSDLKGYSYEERAAKNKVIRYYDIDLLKNLSLFYGAAAIHYLDKASTDAKVKGPSAYYLGEAYSAFGSLDRSIVVTDSFLSSAGMPGPFKVKARSRQAYNSYRKGNKKALTSFWNNLSPKEKANADLLAEVLFACNRLKIDFPQVFSKALAVAAQKKGKKHYALNFAIGSHYLGKKDYKNAVIYMESVRDKGNKNRIEFNAPLLLVSLSEAYYKTKQFSEALEIYFEMSKQFSALRQIQVVMQGIYSLEQKSAGDVKIF